MAGADRGVLDDVRAESADLDAMVADLPAEHWAMPTPAPGWTIAHQIAHLAWTDDAALLALTDPDAFADLQRAAATDITAVIEAGLHGQCPDHGDLGARHRCRRRAGFRTRTRRPAAARRPSGRGDEGLRVR